VSAENDRREAVEKIREDRANHDRNTGRLPNSREIARWANEVGRRNDRRDSEGKPRR
jgi:hypothetical protein